MNPEEAKDELRASIQDAIEDLDAETIRHIVEEEIEATLSYRATRGPYKGAGS